MEDGSLSSIGTGLRAFAPTLDRGTTLASAAERGVGFSTVLAQFGDGLDHLDEESRARVVAEEFVASSLILPVLKQLRESSQAWGPFAQGSYEKTFGSLMDSEVASQIARASTFPLIDRLAHDLRRMAESAERLEEVRRGGIVDFQERAGP